MVFKRATEGKERKVQDCLPFFFFFPYYDACFLSLQFIGSGFTNTLLADSDSGCSCVRDKSDMILYCPSTYRV